MGAQLLMPHLERRYNTAANPGARATVNYLFALAMAGCDTSVTLLDGVRVRLQTGQSILPSAKEANGKNRWGMLCQGALANTVRQWLIYYAWAQTENRCMQWTRNLGLDPATAAGLASLSLMQAAPVTLVSFPSERIKNHLQANPYTGHGWRYPAAIRELSREGWTNFFRGVVPKTLATLGLLVGFNYMVLIGRQKSAAKESSVKKLF
jgi:hypothetical protein